MGRFVRFLLLCVIAGSMPAATAAAAQPADAARQVEVMRGEMAAYGAWLQSANEALAPASAALVEAQREWAAMRSTPMSARGAALAPMLDRLLTQVNNAQARIASLPRPQFPSLDLPEELQTATLARDYRDLVSAYADAIQSIRQLLDATNARDYRAAERAIAPMQAAIERSAAINVRILRARQKAVPADSVDWQSMNVMILHARIGLALSREAVNSNPGIAAMKSELREIAGQLRTSVRDGRAAQESEGAMARVQAEASEGASPQVAGMARELSRLIENASGHFRAGEDLANALDQYLTRNIRAPLGADAATLQLLGSFQQVRAMIEETARNEAQLLAGM